MKIKELKSDKKNRRFSWWVTWAAQPMPLSAQPRYRAYWMEYIPLRNKVTQAIIDYANENYFNHSQRVEYTGDRDEYGIGFETQAEAMQIVLAFSEKLAELEQWR